MLVTVHACPVHAQNFAATELLHCLHVLTQMTICDHAGHQGIACVHAYTCLFLCVLRTLLPQKCCTVCVDLYIFIQLTICGYVGHEGVAFMHACACLSLCVEAFAA